MTQCPHCSSFNEREATFCNQCGGRLGTTQAAGPGLRQQAGGPAADSGRRSAAVPGSPPSLGARRGRLGSAVVAFLLVVLVGVLMVITEDDPPPAARRAPQPVAATPAEPDRAAVVTPPAAPPLAAEPPDALLVAREPAEKRVSALVSRALVVLELRDEAGRAREERGVLLDPSGVVLCRFQALLGARGGTARLLTAEGSRTDILGLSFRDEAADLALVRLAPVKDGYGWVPLSSSDTETAADPSEGEIFVFNDYRAVPAKFDGADILGPGGVARPVLAAAGAVALPRATFLAVDGRGGVLGLCRAEEWEEARENQAPVPYRIVLDMADSLSESLELPVGLTLSDLTERLYVGTFPDLYSRGMTAYHRERWQEAIALFESAVERSAIDAPPEVEADRVNQLLRECYLRQVDALQRAKRYREAVELAEAAVVRYEDEPVLWRLLGESRLALDETTRGIAALLEARALEPSRDLEELLASAYAKVADDHLRAADGRMAELSLIEGIEALPDSAGLHVELAKLYLRFEAYDDATRLLEQARRLDASLANVIDRLLEKIDDALKRRDAVIIPMSSKNSIRATVVLDGRHELDFIIDTGATYTAIPTSVATEVLNYDVRRAERVTVRTANGFLTVPLIHLESVSLGGYSVRNLKVLALPDDLAPGVRLLGLNFLNHFKYTVDAQRQEFRLERP